MRVLGIDPGLTGGLAVVEASPSGIRLVRAGDIETSGEKWKRRVQTSAVLAFLQDTKPDQAFIERAQAMPDQGASSGFVYGRAVGALETCVEGMQVPLTVIEVTAWKKAHSLKGGDKENSRQRALWLFPGTGVFERKMDHGRAEAALIAWFGAMLLRGA